MLELWVHDAKSGDQIRKVSEAVEAGASWSTNITGTGTCSWVVKVGPDAYSGADLDSLFQPNNRILALRWGTVVLGAWKVEDWDYGADQGTAIITGVELRGETKWRMTYFLSGYNASGTLTVTNRSISGAVRAILARFMQWSSDWTYPIDLPADGSGTFSATWNFWEKFTIADLLTQIEDEGYEILFRPYLSGTQLRFQVLVGKKVSSGTSYFHLQAAESPLGGVRFKKSGANQITGGQGTGKGTGQDQPVAYQGGGPFTIPIRDVKQQFPDLEGTRLQAATDAWFATQKDPIVQWTVGSFTFSDDISPEHALTGRGWVLESRGHVVFPEGKSTLRVISSAGSWSNQIKTEVQSGV